MRTVALAVLVAVLAAPSVGVCGECCPAAPVPVSIAAAASCCGNCETTVGRSPDPVSLAAASSMTAPAAAGLVSALVPVPAPPARASILLLRASTASPPLPPPLALRL